MKRTSYTVATVLMWLALPVTALSYLRVWDRLPARVAVHFDANWQPNGWTSRAGALLLGLGIIAFMLVVFTVAACAVRVNRPNAAWPVMIVFYLMLTGLCLVNNWIALRNLNGQPPQAALLLTPGFPHECESELKSSSTALVTGRRLCSKGSRM